MAVSGVERYAASPAGNGEEAEAEADARAEGEGRDRGWGGLKGDVWVDGLRW